MSKQDEIKKAIDEVVDKVLGEESKPEPEDVEKAMPASMPENGGKDNIKSGSPFSDKKELKAKKDEKAKKADTMFQKSMKK